MSHQRERQGQADHSANESASESLLATGKRTLVEAELGAVQRKPHGDGGGGNAQAPSGRDPWAGLDDIQYPPGSTAEMFRDVVDGMRAADVQRRGGGNQHAEDVQRAAAHGITGSSGSLPFLDQIQRSFGAHDVSNSKAHTDAPAAAGAKERDLDRTTTHPIAPQLDNDIAAGRASRSAQLSTPASPVISRLLLRKERDDNGVADGAEQAVVAASSSSGSALPEPIMRKFEGSLGADLSSVRVHTGTESAAAASAVGARAFATGQDIHFGAGQYDPASVSGQHLLAHEVAHTVQQAGGGGIGAQFKLEVSTSGDRCEVEADNAADAMVAGASATVSSGGSLARQIQRDAVAVGNTTQVTFLDDGAGDTVANGEANFSRRMLLETGNAAEALAPTWAQFQLRNVVPETAGAQTQIRQRAVQKDRQMQRAADWMNTPSTTRIYTNAAQWCQDHMTQIEEDVRQENEKFSAFNAWVPRANGFYTSGLRLQAQQNMLGASDNAAMVQQLMAGLRDAGQVAARAQMSHDRGGAQTLPLPPSDNSLVEYSSQTTQAAHEMQTAYLGFQRNVLAQQESDTRHEGDGATARLQQINEVKKFVRDVGKTIDVTMSVVDGAPAAIATATERVQHTGAQLAAAGNRRQAMRGERQTHNPTYVTTDAKGNMIVRNVQTNQDRDVVAGTRVDNPAAESGPTLPTSASDLLGNIADFAYASEIRQINSQLEQIKSRCDAIHAVADMTATKQLTQAFQDKLNDFALKCNQLQQRMAARRQQYLEFGVQLDNFARHDQSSQHAHQAPGQGNERYATIMTVVSAVREVVAMGRGARDGFASPAALRSWAVGIFNNRERADSHRTDIPSLNIPPAELNALTQMYSQVRQFDSNVTGVLRIMEPVDQAAAGMMGGLNQGGGGTASGGQY